MAEWTIAPVLKTGIPPGIVGSNPTPSATISIDFSSFLLNVPQFCIW